MKAAVIIGPIGSYLAPLEVVLEAGDGTVSYLRPPDGGEALEARDRYRSVADAAKRNSRSTTTTQITDVASADAARAIVTSQLSE